MEGTSLPRMEDRGISKGAFRVQIHHPPIIKIFKKKKKKEFTLLFKKLNGYKNINYASHQNV